MSAPKVSSRVNLWCHRGKELLYAVLSDVADLYASALLQQHQKEGTVQPISGSRVEEMMKACVRRGTSKPHDIGICFANRALTIFAKEWGQKHLSVAEAKKQIGILYFLTQDYESAATEFFHAFSVFRELLGTSAPLTAEVGYFLGNLELNRGDPKRAHRVLQEVMGSSGVPEALRPNVAQKFFTAKESARKVVYTELYERAMSTFQSGDFLKAAEIYEELLKVQPQDLEAGLAITACFAQAGNIDGGLEWLNRCKEWGLKDFDRVVRDSDMAPLVQHPRFRALLPSPISPTGSVERLSPMFSVPELESKGDDGMEFSTPLPRRNTMMGPFGSPGHWASPPHVVSPYGLDEARGDEKGDESMDGRQLSTSAPVGGACWGNKDAGKASAPPAPFPAADAHDGTWCSPTSSASVPSMPPSPHPHSPGPRGRAASASLAMQPELECAPFRRARASTVSA